MINKRFWYWLKSRISDNRYALTYVVLLVVLSGFYFWRASLAGEESSYVAWLANFSLSHVEMVATLVSIFVAVVAIEQNAKITEGNLIKELNSEFINNESLTRIESKLEQYYSDYMKKGNSSENISLYIEEEIGGGERQALVNYLVHLEAIAALLDNKVLRLHAINDLVAYRFFIALNNPIVQKWEIEPYAHYYSGCIRLYKKWKNELNQRNMTIPMEENSGVIEVLARQLEGK